MKVYKINQILSMFLCLCIAVSALTGCSKYSADEGSSSAFESTSEENSNTYEEPSSSPLGNPWRETTEEEILEIFGETFMIPDGATDPVFRLLEGEPMAELTFLRDGFAWTVRMKPSESMEDISGLNYVWDYESDINRRSANIDYAEPDSGPTSMSVEYQEKIYAHNGVYIGVALWFSKVNGMQYSTSYKGGDYTSFNTASEVIADLWPWKHDYSITKDWNLAKWEFDERNINWPFGDVPEDIALSDADLIAQYKEMEAVLSLDQDGNTAYSPLQFESMIAALAEGSDESITENLCDVLGRSLKEERIWLRSLLYSTPSTMLMESFVRFNGTFKAPYIDDIDLLSSTSYNISYVPEESGTPQFFEEFLSANLSLETNSAVTHVELDAVPDEESIIVDGITYYHPSWETPYTLSQVGQMEFTNASGETNEILGMMSTEHWYLENDFATGFMKSLDDGRCAFVGILPKEEGSFSLADLQVEELMASKQEKDVCAVIPEIILDETLNVTPSLEMIGYEELPKEGMFDQIIEDKAFTLSSINLTTALRIDPFWQQPANTEDILRNTLVADPINDVSVILDRPFAFMILDTQTGQILFCGVIRSLQ